MVAVSSPAAKTRVKASPPSTVGALIDALWTQREAKRELEAKIKDIETLMNQYEEQLDAKMAADGVTKAVGAHATASFSTSVAAAVDGENGWDQAFPWIAKNKYWHLLRKQLNDAAYRELLEAGKKVPGIQPFTKKRLTLRSLSS
jgi:hypothetical protein